MEDSKPFITLSMLNGHTKWTGPGNALYDAAAQALGQEVRAKSDAQRGLREGDLWDAILHH